MSPLLTIPLFPRYGGTPWDLGAHSIHLYCLNNPRSPLAGAYPVKLPDMMHLSGEGPGLTLSPVSWSTLSFSLALMQLVLTGVYYNLC